MRFTKAALVAVTVEEIRWRQNVGPSGPERKCREPCSVPGRLDVLMTVAHTEHASCFDELEDHGK